METTTDPMVTVCRHPKDWQRGGVRLSKLQIFGFDFTSGGVQVNFPRPMMVAYMMCTDVEEGEIAHSCQHGPAPHRIKIAITKKHNEHVYPRLEGIVEARRLAKAAPPPRQRFRPDAPAIPQ